MQKTCFVIMGFGIKNGINLDLTYNEIIKPCITKKHLIPFQLYEESKYNAYRCDEISGTTAIDYKFVTCLNGADIVIADISTMNANAIYELGARHALKPRSTILLCAKDKSREFSFFDITYVPIIFYEHEGLCLDTSTIEDVSSKLNTFLDFAINSTTDLPDNPIQRALIEGKSYKHFTQKPQNVYKLYTSGKEALDKDNYSEAEITLHKLYKIDSSEENLLLWILAKYKLSEEKNSVKGLVECINIIIQQIDIQNNHSESLFGRLAAICLRIYQLCGDTQYYYSALEYYRCGSNYCTNNLYCPRNYCSTLIRVHEVTDDANIIKEYYYTAIHFAKMFLNLDMRSKRTGSYEERIYYFYNVNDLKSIVCGEYLDYDKVLFRIMNDNDISDRQRNTIVCGVKKLNEDLLYLKKILTFF